VKIEIDHKLLSDSPLNSENEDLFSTVVNKSTNDLIEDIVNGNPTCYLVSGYRGSGKSSFVRKIQSEIGKINRESDKETVFVYLNFSKYKDQASLLRKLIRGLYLEIKDLKSFSQIKSQEQKKLLTERTAFLLEELYDKTFYDISSQSLESTKKEKITVFNIDIIAIIKSLLPVLVTIFFVLDWINAWFDLSRLIHFIAVIVSSILSIIGCLKLAHTISNSRTTQKDFTRKSMFDNEIADYHLLNILSYLKDSYRIVFVLDELDKINVDDIDTLLNEMKPYLVSGTASYIVVAGQGLFYKYFESKTVDDALLSSMFSKFIHIPLLSRVELHFLFEKLLLNNQPLSIIAKQKLDNYVDFLIFESKRVPRKFISLVRQNLTWENGKSFLYVDELDSTNEIFTQINNIIDKIDNTEIAAQSFDDAVKDYCKMQLYLKSHAILSMNKNQFTLEEILNQNEQQ
jgi:Cdc6-like AAA superfamily ATPase